MFATRNPWQLKHQRMVDHNGSMSTACTLFQTPSTRLRTSMRHLTRAHKADAALLAASEHLLRKCDSGLAVLGFVVPDINDDVEGAGVVVAADEYVGAIHQISHLCGAGREPFDRFREAEFARLNSGADHRVLQYVEDVRAVERVKR